MAEAAVPADSSQKESSERRRRRRRNNSAPRHSQRERGHESQSSRTARGGVKSVLPSPSACAGSALLSSTFSSQLREEEWSQGGAVRASWGPPTQGVAVGRGLGRRPAREREREKEKLRPRNGDRTRFRHERRRRALKRVGGGEGPTVTIWRFPVSAHGVARSHPGSRGVTRRQHAPAPDRRGGASLLQ
ncbi:hypothetical protein NL676_002879 [Syzygium grande]|nr:hypothetical protein NL676_002879 [Syzygium grande]